MGEVSGIKDDILNKPITLNWQSISLSPPIFIMCQVLLQMLYNNSVGYTLLYFPCTHENTGSETGAFTKISTMGTKLYLWMDKCISYNWALILLYKVIHQPRIFLPIFPPPQNPPSLQDPTQMCPSKKCPANTLAKLVASSTNCL